MTDDRGLPTSDSQNKSHELETNNWEQNRQARDGEAVFAASRWVLFRWGNQRSSKFVSRDWQRESRAGSSYSIPSYPSRRRY